MNQNTITILFLVGMFIWFVVTGRMLWKELKKDPYGEYNYAQIAATLGVLGTFVGILVGLLSFDTNMDHMQDSVVGLLDGMKTAFFTSVAGMFMSLCFKAEQYWSQLQAGEKNIAQRESKIADLIDYLHVQDEKRTQDNKAMIDLLKSNNQVLQETISKSMADMTKSIVGDGEYTVIGQMKTMRLENRDQLQGMRDDIKNGNEVLIQEFRDFAKNMAENNTKAFIEALNNMMQDFNNKLKEQFGENFKKLNDAVEKLLVWQEHYKETIETVTDNQKQIFDGIEVAKESLKKIEESSKGMTVCAEKMGELIVTATTFNTKLEELLKELKLIGQEAHDVVPGIQSLVATASDETKKLTDANIEAMKKSIESSMGTLNEATSQSLEYVEGVSKQYEKTYQEVFNQLDELTVKLQENSESELNNSNIALDSLNKQADAMIDALRDISTNMTEISRKHRNDLDAEAQATHEAIKKAAEKLGTSALGVTTDISNRLNEMMQTNNENLKKSSENLSHDLDNKITESLNSLGHAMAQITKKFAEDYGPLADKLREVVRLAEQNKNRR